MIRVKKRLRSHRAIETLERRRLLSTSTPTADEQYMLELINRARANPAAEASADNIDLNEGLPAGTITAAAKQPLAFNPSLIDAARGHSSWMLANGLFQHNGPDATDPATRMKQAGYDFGTGASGSGENIAWNGDTVPVSVTPSVLLQHNSLFIDASQSDRGHRTNIENPSLSEVGIGIESGTFQGYNAVMTTQDFAYSGGPFLTGVAFNDSITKDNFYEPGEGLGGVTITATPTADGTPFSTTTWPSGGYTLLIAPGTYHVTASGNGITGVIDDGTVTIGSQNVKADFNTANAVAQQQGTWTSVFADHPTSVTGEPVTLTATVSASGNTASGTVQFQIDGNNTGDPVPLSSGGVAMYTPANLSVGTHSIVAVYSGNSNFAASISPAFTQTVTQGVDTSTTALSVDNKTPAAGDTVSFIATLHPSGTNTPTGTIRFEIDGGSIGSPIAVTNESAQFATSSLSAGPHTVVAIYSGCATVSGSSSAPVSLAVAGGVSSAHPHATLNARTLKKSQQTYSFSVIYSGPIPIDPASIGGSNILVTGPHGYRQMARFMGTVSSNGGKTLSATYRLRALTKQWSTSSNGVYHVSVRPKQVKDRSGQFVLGTSLGSFKVRIG